MPNKFLYFSASLANQTNDHHIGLGVTGHEPQERTFTDATARKQAHTLAAANG